MLLLLVVSLVPPSRASSLGQHSPVQQDQRQELGSQQYGLDRDRFGASDVKLEHLLSAATNTASQDLYEQVSSLSCTTCKRHDMQAGHVQLITAAPQDYYHFTMSKCPRLPASHEQKQPTHADVCIEFVVTVYSHVTTACLDACRYQAWVVCCRGEARASVSSH